MLFESDVISFVCKYLEKQGYRIDQRLNENERGDDIIAADSHGKKCFIEAKGETSSREGSARYGRPFDARQISTHVAKALYRAVQMQEENTHSCKVGIALPATPEHKRKIAKIAKTLQSLSVEIFWVNSDESVHVEGNWN